MQTQKILQASKSTANGFVSTTVRQGHDISRLIEQTKIFHIKPKPPHKCDFSMGWLHKFKMNHVISLYNLSDEKLSADRSS
jgi:hypothetical protein